MKQRRIQGLTLVVTGLLLLALTACAAQPPPATPTPTGPTGAELITQMQKALKDMKSAHLTLRFQVASAEGPVTGTAEFWGQRPGQRRIQLHSDLGSVDGILAVTAGDQGLAVAFKLEKYPVVPSSTQSPIRPLRLGNLRSSTASTFSSSIRASTLAPSISNLSRCQLAILMGALFS